LLEQPPQRVDDSLRRGAVDPQAGDSIDDGGARAAGDLIRRLEIAWPAGVRRLTVLLLPDCGDDEDPALPVTPLDNWLARHPLRLARYPLPRDLPAPNAGLFTKPSPVFAKHLPKRIDHA